MLLLWLEWGLVFRKKRGTMGPITCLRIQKKNIVIFDARTNLTQNHTVHAWTISVRLKQELKSRFHVDSRWL